MAAAAAFLAGVAAGLFLAAVLVRRWERRDGER